jgi:hypothetical protein
VTCRSDNPPSTLLCCEIKQGYEKGKKKKTEKGAGQKNGVIGTATAATPIWE